MIRNVASPRRSTMESYQSSEGEDEYYGLSQDWLLELTTTA